jgi:hypothetical protein
MDIDTGSNWSDTVDEDQASSVSDHGYDEDGDGDDNDDGPDSESTKGKAKGVLMAPDYKKVHSVLLSSVDQSSDLLTPLRLYIMADKYDVPALRLLTRNRFRRAAEIQWLAQPDIFMNAVDEIYENTLDTETDLRDIVCRLAGNALALARASKDFGKYEAYKARMTPIMKKHGGFAVGVMDHALNDAVQFRYKV